MLAPIFLPAILGLAFALGQVEALFSIYSLSNVYALTEKDRAVTKHVLLLRSLDKGVLTYDLGAKKVVFMRWDALTSVDHVFHPPKIDPTFCEITEHICANPESP